VRLWATTIANEPDGGDGNHIPPEGVAYIAHQLALRLAPYGVKLYGPDTATAAGTLDYLPALLDDPVVADSLALVGFHEYTPNPLVGAVVGYVHQRRPDLPVVITEYTSFGFGDLDAGQESAGQLDFAIDVIESLLSHYRSGVDAALYWDAVDYLQPGHDAITKWGLLRGPASDFTRRTHYYGLRQVMPAFQPGARLLDVVQRGGGGVSTLAVETPDRGLAVFAVNDAASQVELSLALSGLDADRYPGLTVTRTDRLHQGQPLAWLPLDQRTLELALPARSITTLSGVGWSDEPKASGF
jgi:hypothetical protein